MSALGQSPQTHSSRLPINVRFAPNSGRVTAVTEYPLSATNGRTLLHLDYVSWCDWGPARYQRTSATSGIKVGCDLKATRPINLRKRQPVAVAEVVIFNTLPEQFGAFRVWGQK